LAVIPENASKSKLVAIAVIEQWLHEVGLGGLPQGSSTSATRSSPTASGTNSTN